MAFGVFGLSCIGFGAGRLSYSRHMWTAPTNAPVLASFALLTSVATSKTLLTKFVFEKVAAPVAMSISSCVVTAVLLLPVIAWKRPLMCIRGHQILSFAGICVAVAVDMACTNVGLSLLPIALHQSIKAMLPAVTVALEFAIWRRAQPLRIILVVCAICTGPIIMALDKNMKTLPSTDSTSKQTLCLGVLMMGGALLSGALKYVVAHAMIQKYRTEMGILGFTFWIEVFSAILLLPWAAANGELNALMQTPHDTTQWLLILGTSAFGGVRIISQFCFLSHTSATSLATSNVFVQVVVTAAGTLLFGDAITPSLVAGALVTSTTTALYAYLKHTNTNTTVNTGGAEEHKRLTYATAPLEDVEATGRMQGSA